MNTKDFWENRLAQGIDLHTTGHRAFDLPYNQWLYQAQKDRLDLLLTKNQVPINKNTSLLDIGSGWGYFVEYFFDKGVTAIEGIDIAKPSIEYLQERYPRFTFYQADISANTIPTQQKYDVITAFSVVFHIVDDVKFTNALLNMIKLLKPGGFLILCDTFERRIIPTPGHVRFRSISAYAGIFYQSDMQVIDILPQYFFMNRTFIPKIGPWIINHFNLGKYIYFMDTKVMMKTNHNFGQVKLMLAQKKK